jgi:chemotaxis protein MotB
MIKVTAATVSVAPLTMLMLSACVWQSDYDKLQAQNHQLQAQVTGLQREASFVEAGDLLFPEGGYQLSAGGKTELSNNIVPKLTGLQNAKVVVYGYTDNLPVGAPLKRAGINDNLTLSSRRAGDVVTYLVAQGVDPNIISAKGFGDTHPVAPNNTPADRANNRRIVITVQGPGAPGA